MANVGKTFSATSISKFFKKETINNLALKDEVCCFLRGIGLGFNTAK